MKGISAVVATYKRRDQLVTLFESILLNNIENFEAIVVDQNKDGLIDDLIAEYSGKIDLKHLKSDEPNNAKARNMGAAIAKYSIICFPDDDCWYDKDTLNRVITHFDDPNYKTDLLIINWQQLPGQPQVSRIVTKEELFSFRSVGYGTIVLYFRTEAFMKIGGFMEHIGMGKYIGGGEDTELTFRAASNNLNIYYSKEIKINHLYNPITTRDFWVIRTRQRAMGFLYAKYDVPYWVVVRGIAAPFVKMVCSVKNNSRKKFYHIACARVEGLVHGLKNRKNVLYKHPEPFTKRKHTVAL